MRFVVFILLISSVVAGSASAQSLDSCSKATTAQAKIKACSDLIAKSKDARARGAALFERARAKTELKDNEGALADYAAAINLGSSRANAHYNRARILHSLGKAELALTDINLAIKLDPPDVLNRRLRGLIYRDLRQHEPAIADFDFVIASPQRQAMDYVRRARSREALRQFDRMLADAEAGIAFDPKSVALVLLKAEAEKRLRTYAAAIATCERATTMAPQSAEAWECLGDAQELSGAFQPAIGSYERAISIDPTFGVAYLGLGNVLRAEQRWAEAVEAYTKALTYRGVNEAYTLERRAGALDHLKRHKESLADYEKLVAMEPENGTYRLRRGITQHHLGNHQAAIVDFSAVIDRNSKSARSLYWRAKSREAIRQYEEALDDVIKSASIDGDDLDVLLLKADLEKRFKRYSDAVATCQSATRKEPKDATAWECLGDALELNGDNYGAIGAYRRAISINPRMGIAYLGLGNSMAATNRPLEAIDAYTKALSGTGASRRYALERRAGVLMKQQRFKEAQNDYDELIKLDPADEAYRHQRALAAANAGSPFNAISLLDDAIRKNPSESETYKIRAELHALLGDWRRALADYNAYLDKHPREPAALAARGNLHALLGDDLLAIADIGRAAEISPEIYSHFFDLRRLYEKRGEADILIGQLTRRVAANPDDLTSRDRLKDVLRSLGRHELALAELQKLITANEAKNRTWALPSLFRETAESLQALGRLDEALSVADRAMSQATSDSARANAMSLRASLRLAGGDVDAALRDLARAVGYDPSNVRWFTLQSPAAHREKIRSFLIDELAKAIQTKPTPELHTARAWLLADAKRGPEAAAEFQLALERKKTDLFLRTSRARVLKEIGQSDRAVEELSMVIAANDGGTFSVLRTVSALRQRAETLRDMGRFDEALADADNPIWSWRQDLESRLALIRSVYAARGALPAYIARLTRYLSDAPNAPVLLRERAEAYWSAGDATLAMADLSTIMTLRPTDVSTLDLRGRWNAQLGRLTDAIQDLRKALTFDPRNSDRLQMLAEHHIMVGDRKVAMELMAKAIEVAPNSSVARSRRAWMHIATGASAAALEDAQRAVELSPTSPYTLGTLAKALAVAGQTSASRERFDAALKETPTYDGALFHRALLLLELGDAEAARRDLLNLKKQHLEAIAKTKIASPSARVFASRILLALGEHEEALKEAQAALEFIPGAPAYLQARGLVLKALGRRDEAIADLRAALAKDGMLADARKALTELGVSVP